MDETFPDLKDAQGGVNTGGSHVHAFIFLCVHLLVAHLCSLHVANERLSASEQMTSHGEYKEKKGTFVRDESLHCHTGEADF